MKRITLFLLLVIFSLITFADNVPVEKAKKVAQNYMKSQKKDFNNVVSNIETINYKGYDVIYAFNFVDGGYILISTDDNAYPILSFAFEGKYDEKDPKMPPSYKWWLENYKEQLIIAQTQTFRVPSLTTTTWDKYYKSVVYENTKSTNAVTTPLLDVEGIKWDQTSPYNADCPGGPDPVGCVATAMCQIMRYHKYPEHGEGSHSYNENDYGQQSVNFGNATYNWDNMPAQVYSANADVARISYHAGVAVDMDYGPGGSGAMITGVVRPAFVNYFKYHTDATFARKDNMSDAQWKTKLKSSLDNSWPVFYAGNDQAQSMGHAFVCDGYNNNNEFHFNWGWSGYSNSWNQMGDIVPGGTGTGGGDGDYSYGNRIVYNIHPQNVQPTLNAEFSADATSIDIGGSVHFTDNSTQGSSAITSWHWTFTGGNPGTFNGHNPPAISYANEGTYNVKLKVGDGSDNDTELKTGYIKVGLVEYCDAEATVTTEEFISKVHLESINKSSQSSGYSDFTSEIATITNNNIETATVTIDNPYQTDKLYVWIDWNIDGDFDDAGEQVCNKVATSGSVTFDVSLPSFITEAYNGKKTRMRMRLNDTGNGSNETPCGDNQYGEVEDYTIEISKTTDINNIVADNFSIYPNPNNGIFTINTKFSNSNIKITNVSGETIYNGVSNQNLNTIDLSDAKSGVYFVQVSSNEGISIKKIIIK